MSAIEDDETPEIWERMGVCGGYNSAVDEQVVGVARLIVGARRAGGSLYCDDIAKQLGMTPEHVELIQYLLAGARYDDRPAGRNDPFDYGTSPRGLFVGDEQCADRFMADCDRQLARWGATTPPAGPADTGETHGAQ